MSTWNKAIRAAAGSPFCRKSPVRSSRRSMNRNLWLSTATLMDSLLLSSCATTHTEEGGVGQVGSYGPLVFNRTGSGDFYMAQKGRFVPAEFRDGAIEIHLHSALFGSMSVATRTLCRSV